VWKTRKLPWQYKLDSRYGLFGFSLDAAVQEIFTEDGMEQAGTIRSGREDSKAVWLHGIAQAGWRRAATVAAAGLALGFGYHVVFGQNGLTAYEQKRRDARELEMQLQNLQKENDRLKGHVDRLQNDPNAIEHQAREDLHYARPGEVIYTLPATPSSTGGSANH